MTSANIDNKIVSKTKEGFLWSFLENASLQGIRFLIGILMARLLSPADYGMVGMLTVFIVISDLLINSGLGSALTKLQDRTEKDFSTAFYFNVVMGVGLYFLLYSVSPYISEFYKLPLLTDLAKIIALSLLFNSFSVVPNAILQINLRFRTISFVSIITAILSGLSGLYFAYHNFGVWALVYSTIIGNAGRVILLYSVTRWYPKTFIFIKSLRRMLSYGVKLLLSTLIDAIYTNIYPLVIGRVYTADTLGYYSRAQGYSNLPSSTLTMMINKVCFPTFCKQSANFESLIDFYKRIMNNVALFVFPLMFLLMALAKPLVVVLISSKWLPCVPYLQILCLATMWYPILEVNLSVIKAMGYSGIVLKTQIIDKIFALVVLIITLHYNVVVMCCGAVLISFFSLIVNFSFSKKILLISVVKQFKLIIAPLVGSLVMFIFVMFLSQWLQNPILMCIVGTVCGILVYGLFLRFMGISILKQIIKVTKL